MSLKLLGLGLVAAGVAMVFVFPDISGESSYQPTPFTYSGILLGAALIVVGAILLFVG